MSRRQPNVGEIGHGTVDSGGPVRISGRVDCLHALAGAERVAKPPRQNLTRGTRAGGHPGERHADYLKGRHSSRERRTILHSRLTPA